MERRRQKPKFGKKLLGASRSKYIWRFVDPFPFCKIVVNTYADDERRDAAGVEVLVQGLEDDRAEVQPAAVDGVRV